MSIRPLTAAVLAAGVLAAPAAAHVTVNPGEAAAGGFARFAVRVPTERPDAETVEVTLELPEGVFFVSFQPKEGWEREVEMEQLDEPVEIFGQQITERVARVTWSGGRIRPGEFDEFGMSVRMPEEGDEVVFPAVQRYSSGEVVRWIGPEDSDTPAPRVTLTPAEEEEEAEPASDTQAAETQPAPETEPATAAAGDAPASGGDDTRANVALGFGIAGLVAGLAALGTSLFRRPRDSP